MISESTINVPHEHPIQKISDAFLNLFTVVASRRKEVNCGFYDDIGESFSHGCIKKTRRVGENERVRELRFDSCDNIVGE